MKNSTEYQVSKARILDLLEHPEKTEEGKKRSKIYSDHLALSLSHVDSGKPDGMKLGGAAVLLLLAVLCYFMRGGAEGLMYKIYIGIAAVACIGGFFVGSFIGVIAVALVFSLVYVAIEKFGLLLAIVLFVAAMALLFIALRESGINKTRQESEIRRRKPVLEEDYTAADRDFKFRLISDFAKLAEDHSLTVDEYEKEATAFAQRLIGHYPGEIEGHTYSDVEQMIAYAESERMKLNPNYIKNDGLKDADLDLPFLLYPEYSFFDAQNGLTLSGKIVHGRISCGDTLEIVGSGIKDRKAVVGKIKSRSGGKTIELKRADHGEVSLLFPDLKKTDFVKGCAVAAPGSIRLSDYVKAKVRFALPENGEKKPFYSGTLALMRAQDRLLQSEAVINFNGLKDEAYPGDETMVHLDLATPLPLEKGMHFYMTHLKKEGVLLTGTILEVYGIR
ncbi:MAG: hypothetical protein IIY23_05415 [Erysipelotrichaceae bacterium]|nr:hypothetical protein [Erysipelotrichaceae bacterium]